MRPFCWWLCACVAVLAVERGLAQAGLENAAPVVGATLDGQEELPPPVPRWREGGTPYDPAQALFPYRVELSGDRDVPTSGLIASPPEYGPMRGVLFKYISGHWTDVVTECVVKLTQDSAYDDIAYVVVNSASQQTTATNQFASAGADLGKVQFFIVPGDSLWLRDYGPHFIWQDGALGIVDGHYYPGRPNDNFSPTLLGDDHMIMPTYDIGLYYSGGNFLPGPDGTAFMSSLITLDNPTSAGFTEAFIAELFTTYQGIAELHIMPQLPFSVDGTGHIDMWMYVVDEDDVIISQFQAGSDPTAIQITNEAVPYMEALGFTVHRTPAWNAYHSSGYWTHFTHTNAFRVNDRIFIATFGNGNPAYRDEDIESYDAWVAAAGPGVTIVQIDCYPIIWASGAIHCIVMQVPQHTDEIPAVHVISPDGGELLVSGTTHTIEWVATDTYNEVIPQVDLYYTIDDGETYEFIATTTDSGSYAWAVPDAAPQAKVKVVATAADADQAEALSADYFQIAAAEQTVYDFSTGAGEDKFVFGYQTYAWSYVDETRMPVSGELSAGEYSDLVYSDAEGGDWDTDRYVAPTPSVARESTHVLEFTIAEDPAEIDDIAILWEGYADDCAQAELYVWDYVEGQWGDGAGLFDQNRFMDNWAGNRDGYLTGNIQADFESCLDADGQMTLLLYAERTQQETFHDFVSVTVSRITQTLVGDMNCDGVVNFFDIDAFVVAVAEGEAGYLAAYPDCHWLNADCNGDGNVNFFDIDGFVTLVTEG